MPTLHRISKAAVMNPALGGIKADFGPKYADTFRNGLSANFVLANGSMSSNQSCEGNFESDLFMKTSSLSQRATP